ncbi:hypothetical protein [Rheinheimera nanhaiensis]|uniref:Lipoprotein n=1 Tax=Rheinheimera nanhaiensis E407-8 TaxID=562729 RepID=I1E0M3_9GAMM|nr:hypothetical protein RNAN_2864 [Rheinheimera nanhaiensis E407-8]
MIRLIVLFIGVTLIAGCTIKHPIAKDYSQYLANNKGEVTLPKSTLEADYEIDSATETHRYEFRAATVGYAHLWIVEFGQMLEATLQSDDVQASFGKLSKINGTPQNSGLLRFNLENYEFKDHMAHVTLNISLEQDGKTVLNKTYHAKGKSQGGKMFFGGPFAMKNATQQSTKFAIDEILRDFINDTKAATVAAR